MPDLVFRSSDYDFSVSSLMPDGSIKFIQQNYEHDATAVYASTTLGVDDWTHLLNWIIKQREECMKAKEKSP